MDRTIGVMLWPECPGRAREIAAAGGALVEVPLADQLRVRKRGRPGAAASARHSSAAANTAPARAERQDRFPSALGRPSLVGGLAHGAAIRRRHPWREAPGFSAAMFVAWLISRLRFEFAAGLFVTRIRAPVTVPVLVASHHGDAEPTTPRARRRLDEQPGFCARPTEPGHADRRPLQGRRAFRSGTGAPPWIRACDGSLKSGRSGSHRRAAMLLTCDGRRNSVRSGVRRRWR